MCQVLQGEKMYFSLGGGEPAAFSTAGLKFGQLVLDPAGLLPETPLYQARSLVQGLLPLGTPFPSPADLPWKTHGLCSGAYCAEKSVLCCFVSSVVNCWAEKYFPCSQPSCSTRLGKPLPAGWRLGRGL